MLESSGDAMLRPTVVMEAVVQTDGTVGEFRVVRSLDKKFGVDKEAVKALKAVAVRAGKEGRRRGAALNRLSQLRAF